MSSSGGRQTHKHKADNNEEITEKLTRCLLKDSQALQFLCFCKNSPFLCELCVNPVYFWQSVVPPHLSCVLQFHFRAFL